MPPSTVHPRLRGEHRIAVSFLRCSSGSSPPTRGTPHPDLYLPPKSRFIPAYAGNTEPPSGYVGPVPVHPRLRGEHQVPGGAHHQRIGSSPPTRGTRDTCISPEPDGRFIPAYAGNTLRRPRAGAQWPVHPRLRGEHCSSSVSDVSKSGSSPPTRGTRLKGNSQTAEVWFIPAYAGNTRFTGWPVPQAAVHPRLRGEHGKVKLPEVYYFGSSPPTRGTRRFAATGTGCNRFIPAYAGNTDRVVILSPIETVHPRLRGEHFDAAELKEAYDGSSPPTRGTLFL